MTGADIVMAGFGGQGVLLTGKLLAHAAMSRGMEVSWLPSYGPEMRGGTCNVTVCISDSPIGSPYVTKPDMLIAMNQPSLEKFGPNVESGGLIIVNSTLIPITIDRADCQVLYVDATEMATKAGTSRAANIVLLGVMVGASEIIEKETALTAISEEFSRKAKFVPINVRAFESGFVLGQTHRQRSSR